MTCVVWPLYRHCSYLTSHALQGGEWQEQRRFALRHLRDFGFGKSSMEGLIHDEIRELTEAMDSEVGNPEGMPVRNRFNISIVNALWKIISGKRYKISDPHLLKVSCRS